MNSESNTTSVVIGDSVHYQGCYIVNKHPGYTGVIICCWYSDVRRLTHDEGVRIPGVIVVRKAGLKVALEAVLDRVQFKFYAVQRSENFKGPVILTSAVDYMGLVQDLDGKWRPNTFSKTYYKGDEAACVEFVTESLRRIREMVEKNRGTGETQQTGNSQEVTGTEEAGGTLSTSVDSFSGAGQIVDAAASKAGQIADAGTVEQEFVGDSFGELSITGGSKTNTESSIVESILTGSHEEGAGSGSRVGGGKRRKRFHDLSETRQQ